jgi:hypothetical protein
VTDINGHVRISNAQIFEAVTAQGRKLDRLESKFTDVVKPGLDTHGAQIDALREMKANKTETAEIKGDLKSVRNQLYAMASGTVGALIALRTLGVI